MSADLRFRGDVARRGHAEPSRWQDGQYETTVSTVADRLAWVVIVQRIGIAAEKVFHRGSYETGWATGLARHRSRD
jgi:hypothetical protein